MSNIRKAIFCGMTVCKTPSLYQYDYGQVQQFTDIEQPSAKENIPEGGYFIMHDIVYEATDAILKGEEAKPGKNCVERNLNEIKKTEVI